MILKTALLLTETVPSNDLDHLKAEIESLLENEVAEGILRDYKRKLYEDKKEFLKDASSFANSRSQRLRRIPIDYVRPSRR